MAKLTLLLLTNRNYMRISAIFSTLILILAYGCVEKRISAQGKFRPVYLRCEYRVNPIGIDATNPHLSWTIDSNINIRCQKQTAYQILVASSYDKLATGQANLWDSGKVKSDYNTHVAYKGNQLTSQMQCFWKVRIWDRKNMVSPWSEPAIWTMGLLDKPDWKAMWIGFDNVQGVSKKDNNQDSQLKDSQWIWFPEGDPTKAAPPQTRYFRRRFILPEPTGTGELYHTQMIKKTICLISADDSFEMSINGKTVANGSGHTRSTYRRSTLSTSRRKRYSHCRHQ